ncbi:flagellar protein FlaG [Marinobacter sp.]|uniref:flagellar protein FlaG n=1 Tax=Marinobacter sp. TaxID=50741 RepID=UPI0035623055
MNDMKLDGQSFMKLVQAGDQSPVARQSQFVNQDVATDSAVSSGAQSVRSKAQTDELGNAVTRLNDYVQNIRRDLQFEVDMERGETIVRVVDNETQEVIRQIPDEVALRLAENLQHDEPLTLFDMKV